MKINLIQGSYQPSEAISLITKLIEEKIKFQEDKITRSCNEEDIKMREFRIKELQNELATVRKGILDKGVRVEMRSTIEIN